MSTSLFDIAVLMVIVLGTLAVAVFGGGLEEKRTRREARSQSGRKS